MKITVHILFLLLILGSNTCFAQNKHITLEDLLMEMVDRDALARFWINFAKDNSITTKKVDLGTVNVREGKNKFTITFLENSPNADLAFFGWDYLQLK